MSLKSRISFNPPGDGRSLLFRKPFVIAEAGVNHEGNLDTACRLITEAAAAGADAIKFQTYRADTIAVRDSPAYWDTTKEPVTSQHRLFQKYDKFWKVEYEKLKRCCDNEGIEFLSTPFDTASADFLNDLMSVFKISSSDITNKPFVEYLANFGKPILLSTGASNLDEVDSAVSWIAKSNVPVALMHCVLNYPTATKDANLAMICDLKRTYPDKVIGYSDHTEPEDMRILEVAWLLGAQILEKHFTHDKILPGNDHYHAMDKHDLAHFLNKITSLKEMLGNEKKQALDSEAPARQHARRSLVVAVPIRAGTVITADMLTWKRPGHGISPASIGKVVGMVSRIDLPEDHILSWEDFT
jgi:sialic acid synthase SpsE